MPELTREEKLKLIEKLPKRLQDFLYSEDTGAVLLYFEKKYNLPSEKARLLSNLVSDIILGITPITSLAQEINSKITSDAQAAMNLAQELNGELLAPIMAPAPLPKSAAPTQSPKPQAPSSMSVDRYREPTTGPEIIDLRNQPKAGPPLAGTPPVGREGGLPPGLPISAAPIPPSPRRSPDEGGPKPLTFTKPIEPVKPTPLIEAEPHKEPMADLPSRPQYIIRPPGLAPTDLPHDVLDLRKDKGEF